MNFVLQFKNNLASIKIKLLLWIETFINFLPKKIINPLQTYSHFSHIHKNHRIKNVKTIARLEKIVSQSKALNSPVINA
jgi:hypothetical protein